MPRQAYNCYTCEKGFVPARKRLPNDTGHYFCSRECANANTAKVRADAPGAIIEDRHCAKCGNVLTTAKQVKYCSRDCANIASSETANDIRNWSACQGCGKPLTAADALLRTGRKKANCCNDACVDAWIAKEARRLSGIKTTYEEIEDKEKSK
jgi:hypothetical protein